VEIAAQPEEVFRWICQLRVAPYSYDWINHPASLAKARPEREALEVAL
jgi:hypothetical protein